MLPAAAPCSHACCRIPGRSVGFAIRGLGGTARLVMLPHEPHWYTARESNEHFIYEMLTWFDRYVKNAEPRQAQAAIPET